MARHPVHVTSRLVEGLPSLRRWEEYEVILRALRAGCEKLGFRLVHYSVQSNHLHLVVEGSDRRAYTSGIRGLLVRVAMALNKFWGRKGRVIAHRFHEHVLCTPREVRAALAYVLRNARRHGCRLAVGAVDPFSSGRSFDGWRGADAARGRFAAGVARARTWLLRVGWRRHGLVDP